MAKFASPILGRVIQSIGNAVAYMSNGQNIVRTKPLEVSNPRTAAQMAQRIKLAPLVAFYRANKEWMKKAFETKPQNYSDYNAFVKANMASTPYCFTKQMAAGGAAIVGPWQVTKGSLVPYALVADSEGVLTDLYLGSTLVISATTTVADFVNAVLANNNNDRQGDQVSIIIARQYNNSATGLPYLSVKAYELILDPTDTQLLEKFLPVSMLSNKGGALHIRMAGVDGACTLIQSRNVSGKLLVSTQSMIVADASINAAYLIQSLGDEAAASYGSSTRVFLDSYEGKSQETAVATFSVSSFTLAGTARAAGSYVGPLTAGQAFSVRVSDASVLADNNTVQFLNSNGGVIQSVNLSALTVSGSNVSGTIPANPGTSALARIRVNSTNGAAEIQFSTTAPSQGGGGNNDDNPDGIE